MSVTVNIGEAKTRLSELVHAAEAGEEVVLARNGHPVARLVAIAEAGPKKLREIGFLAGAVPAIPDSVWFDPLPVEELEAWGM